MKEYKFRAWSEEHKEMICWQQFEKEATMRWFVGEDLAVMQYIGYQDVDGVEIYEGDILKYHWANAGDGIVTIRDVTEGYPLDSEKCLVLGNIFENPEILEEVQYDRRTEED